MEGQPQIRIDFRLGHDEDNQDLRDRILGRFLKKLGIPSARTGFWCYCRMGHETHNGLVAFIEPMDIHILSLHFPEIENVLTAAGHGAVIESLPDRPPQYPQPVPQPIDISNINPAFLPAIDMLIKGGILE